MDKKFKALLIIIGAWTLVFQFPFFCTGAPSVSNVRATQRVQSQLVDIFYDLSATNSGPFSVSVVVSTNNGTAYDLSASSFSGSGAGSAVVPGIRKQIVWNSGSDWPGKYSSSIRFKVIASNTPPANMILIPPGNFVMGFASNVFDAGYAGAALPQHSVYVSAFYIDRYEVTAGLWSNVYAWALTHGYTFDARGSGKATNHPVNALNWYDVVKWCNARSEMEGRTPAYYISTTLTPANIYRIGRTNVANDWVRWDTGYRLPTEAEWEKAARGGVENHRFPWIDSDEIQHARANYSSTNIFYFDTSPTRGRHPAYTNTPVPYTSPVGSFAPNGYGLYDMAGNLWEWCWDWGANLDDYSTSSSTDPRGTTLGLYRILRGGAWDTPAVFCDVSIRGSTDPLNRFNIFGFRVVIPPNQ